MRRRRLIVECLEDRTVPATYGIAWPNPGQLTLSFVPDGTLVNGSPSVLFQTLNAQEMAQNSKLTSQQATQLWETAILRGFQTWAVNANINIGLVPDDGAPLGTAGAPQGDPRFGDIRISMVPLLSSANGDLVAFSQPYSPLAGTWAGDVELNAGYFGAGSSYDVFTVAMHEAGHVFGFPDTLADPSSVMYRYYEGVRAGLSAGDIAMLQALYGVRQADAYEPNNSLVTAAPITPGSASHVDSQTGLLVMDGDLTVPGETDFYSYKPTGKAAGSFTITLHTQGVSLLVPQLTVYDSKGQVVQTEVNQSPLDGDLASITVPNAKPNTTYYFEVQGPTGGVFSVGSYQLELSTGQTSSGSTGNSSKGSTNGPTVINLQAKTYRTDGRFDYAVQGTIAAPSQTDVYSFHSPSVSDGQPTVMTVTAWGTQPDGLQPQLVLEDVHGNPLPVQVLVNQDGTYTFQLPNAPAGTKYLLAVQPEDPNGAASTGSYFLGIDFGTVPIQFDTLVANQVLNAANPQQASTLNIAETQLFHVALTATGGAAVMTVYDAQGNVLDTLTAADGETVTTNLVLNPGAYTFQVTRAAGATGPVTYTLQYLEVSDAIGPEPIDTTLHPAPATGSGLAYWWQVGYSAYLGLAGSTAGSPAGTPIGGGATSPSLQTGSGGTTGGNGTGDALPTGSSPGATGTPTGAVNSSSTGAGSSTLATQNAPSAAPLGGPSGPGASTSAGAGQATIGTTSSSPIGSSASATAGISANSASGNAASGSLSGLLPMSPGGASGSVAIGPRAADTTPSSPGLNTVLSTPVSGLSPGATGGDFMGGNGPVDSSASIAAVQWLVRINQTFGPLLRKLVHTHPGPTPPSDPVVISDLSPGETNSAPITRKETPAMPGPLPRRQYAADRARWFAAQAVPQAGKPGTLADTWLYVGLLLGLGVYPLVRQFHPRSEARNEPRP